LINKLVLSNLKHRWVRTLLSALVIGVQVTSILTLVGLSRGMLQYTANQKRNLGADIVLRPGSSTAFALSSAPVKVEFIPFVAKQPHVKQAVGIYSMPAVLLTPINGIDLDQFTKLGGGFHFISGGPFQGPDDIIIDEYYARQNNLSVGQTIQIIHHPWRISGIVESGRLGRLVVPLKTLQELSGNPDKVNQILVKIDDSDRTNDVVAQLNKTLDGNLQAISVEELASQYSINNLPPLKAFIAVITVLSVFVGFLVVFLSMYTAVIERTREIGVLKALGAQPTTILNLLIRETVVLAGAGSIIGIVLAFGAKALIMRLVPASLQVVTVPEWWIYATGIALLGGLLGAIYPGLKAARQDAIEALAYD
jgi:putative ABC transport system permease protein